MVGHRLARLLGHAPREDAAARIPDVQRAVVPRHGHRRDARRLRIVLAVVRRVHRQFGAEHQLALPLEAYRVRERERSVCVLKRRQAETCPCLRFAKIIALLTIKIIKIRFQTPL